MATNYGFLEGLANGANTFLNSYMTSKKLNQDQRMQELAAGVQKDESGNYVYTPEKRLAMDLASAQNKQQMGFLTPGSAENQRLGKLVQSYGVTVPENATKAEFDVIAPFAKEQMQNKASLEKHRAELGVRSRENKVKEDEKNERQEEQDVQKLSKDVAGTQDLLGGLDEVERKLGGKLENFSADTKGNLMRDGKSVDLPGVSAPGLGRVSFYSGEARDLNSAASRVFNATLKDRSGGSVTDSEMERMRQEFNAGKYNSEPELISALQRYKRQTQLVLKDREAGFNPSVVKKYSDQGGRTSQSLGFRAGEKTIIKTQTNKTTGQKRIVYSDGTTELVNSSVAGK